MLDQRRRRCNLSSGFGEVEGQLSYLLIGDNTLDRKDALEYRVRLREEKKAAIPPQFVIYKWIRHSGESLSRKVDMASKFVVGEGRANVQGDQKGKAAVVYVLCFVLVNNQRLQERSTGTWETERSGRTRADVALQRVQPWRVERRYLAPVSGCRGCCCCGWLLTAETRSFWEQVWRER